VAHGQAEAFHRRARVCEAGGAIEGQRRRRALKREEREAETGSPRLDASYQRLTDAAEAGIGRDVVQEDLARSRHGSDTQDRASIVGHEDVVGANPGARVGWSLVGKPPRNRARFALMIEDAQLDDRAANDRAGLVGVLLTGIPHAHGGTPGKQRRLLAWLSTSCTASVSRAIPTRWRSICSAPASTGSLCSSTTSTARRATP